MKRKEIIALLGATALSSVSMAACGNNVPTEPMPTVAEETTVDEIVEQETEEPEEVVEETVIEEAGTEDTIEETAEVTEEPATEEAESEFEIEAMDDTVMYAQQSCNVRTGNTTDYDVIGNLSLNEEVIVVGKTVNKDNKPWYVLKNNSENDDGYRMVAASMLGSSKVQQSSKPNTSDGNDAYGNGGALSDCSDCYVMSDDDDDDCRTDCGAEWGFFDNCDYGDCSADCGWEYITVE